MVNINEITKGDEFTADELSLLRNQYETRIRVGLFHDKEYSLLVVGATIWMFDYDKYTNTYMANVLYKNEGW